MSSRWTGAERIKSLASGTDSSAKSPAPTLSRRAFNEFWSALAEERAGTGGSQAKGQPAQWTPDLLQRLDWRRFEELCASYFEAVTAGTPRLGSDGGIDIYLYSPVAPEDPPTVVIQCKHWNTYKVCVKPVRELYGVMAAE